MELKCKFHYSDCNISSADITEPRTLITGCEGVHSKDYTNNKVHSIEFFNTTVHYFPRSLPDIFPHLTTLKIINCGLKRISRDDLIGLGSLRELFLIGNELISVPNDLLTGMTNLHTISFESNQIEFLSSDLFKPIIRNDWQLIDFRANRKINNYYQIKQYNELKLIGRVETLAELTDKIDRNCEKPLDEAERAQEITLYRSDQSTGLAAILKSGDFTDFTIITDSKVFKAHKLMLAVHSRLLAEKFKDEDLSEMRLEGVTSESVDALLQYVYTGNVPRNVDAIELFTISTKLQVRTLQLICEAMVLEDLRDSNASAIFMLGHALKCDKITKEAFARLRNMHPELCEDFIEKPEKLKQFFAIKEQFESMRRQLVASLCEEK